MTAAEDRVLAVVFALTAIVCLAATAWTAYDLVTQPFTWPNLLTAGFGVAVTALLVVGARFHRRRAAQAGGDAA